jgi:hypothetical protein
MATYSDRLRLELMTTGEFSGTWGDRTNVNMGTILEQAIAGLKTVTMTDADKTLTTATGNAVSQGGADYTDDEARYAILSIESSEDLTSSRNVVIPAKEKIYIVKNGTTGSQQITVKTSAGTGIVIPNGKTMVIYCDGTDTQSAVDNFPSGTTIAGSEIATTTTGQTIQNKTIQSSTVDSTTVGATTASTGAFTTLTSSSTTTLDGTTIPSDKTLVDTDSAQTLESKTLTSPYVDQIVHEGTANEFETTLAFADPTADRTITFPDSTGTVSLSDTTYTAGTGLTLDGTEFDLNVNATTQTTAAENVTSTTNRTYAVQVDSSDNLVVNVPWVDTDTQNTYTAGTGLELTGGTFSVNLGTATTNTATQASVGTADGRTYLVQTDSDGDLVVNVPWENTEGTDTTYSSGTGLTLTDTTFNANVDATVQTTAANTVTTTASRTYAIQVDGSDNLVVNVPWSDSNTEYSTATSSTLGLVKLGDDTEQATGANAVTSTSSRTYAVQVNASDQLVVNVPWSDTDENTEYTAGTGLTLTGTEFSADFDGSFDSLTDVPPTLANATNTSLTFEGSSDDDFETVLNISNPTADRTITFPDLTGTVSLITATETLTNKTLTSPYVNEILHEGTADDFETTLAFTDPTADRTITFPDAGGTVALTSDIGTLGAQASDSVDIDGGAIDGVTLAANSGITVNGTLTFGSSGGFKTTGGRYVFERELTVGSLGPSLSLYLDSGGSNTSDGNILGRYEWHGDNSAQQFTDYAYFEGRSIDVTDGTEDGEIRTWVRTAGGMKNLFNISGTERVLKNDQQAAQITISNSLVTFDESVHFDSPVTFDSGTYGFNSVHGLFMLNSGATTATKDAGFVVERGSTGTNVAWYWDESSGTFNAAYVTGTNTSDTLTVAYMSTPPGITAGACIFDSLSFIGLSETVERIRDEDDMTSNDENALATQQSIKAYVDSKSVSNTSGSAPLYAARAWGSFDGSDYTGSVVDLTNFTTGNVSSIDRTGTGQYTINFSTAMPNTTYTFIGTINGNTPSGGGRELLFFATSQATGSVTVQCQREETETFVDAGILSFVIFAG